MVGLDILFVGADERPVWPDLDGLMVPNGTTTRGGRLYHHVRDSGTAIKVAGIERGMASGKPSVALRLDLPNGSVVVAETSLALFLMAADTLRARFGDPRHAAPPTPPTGGTPS